MTIKTIFLTLLYNDIFYIMDSEPALQREYADLVMVVRPDQRQYDLLDFLIEFKYVSLADVGLSGEAVRGMEREELAALPAVAKKQADAQTKLVGYRETLQSLHDKRLRLRCFSVVAIGYERLVWLEVGQWIVDSGQWIEPYPPSHRFTVPPLHRSARFNASTLHRFTASTLQRSTASTFQRFNARPFPRYYSCELRSG